MNEDRAITAHGSPADEEVIMLRIGKTTLLIAFLATSACATPSEEITVTDQEELMRAFYGLWASKDLEDAEYHGREEIKASLADDFSAVPDVEVEIVSLFASQDRGAVEWVWSGTHTEDYPGLISATGRPFSVRGVAIFEFEKGKIKRHLDYYDAAGFLYQLGVKFLFPEG
jgi:steroid delta-isomerase-like uncharacterized protein